MKICFGRKRYIRVHSCKGFTNKKLAVGVLMVCACLMIRGFGCPDSMTFMTGGLPVSRMLSAAAAETAAAAQNTGLKDSVQKGSIITFGRYEQDNVPGNGQEPIDWMVLEVQEGKCLLLSKYGLDVLPYNSKKKGVSWENCSLRKWLNNDFLYTAFTAEERSAILLTNVDNSSPHRFSDWKSEGGPNTQDYIYLLSVEEGISYFELIRDNTVSNMKAKCAPTEYAIQRGVYIPPEDTIGTVEGKKSGSWWLRSPGRKQTYAAGVGGLGNLGTDSVDTKDNAVRPCLWLNLNAGIADTLQITAPAE